ncbi:MAG: GIY-YIG nuclease family protein [bacterium]|nr:GIY-YIG nuclease family protein [bacterium]
MYYVYVLENQVDKSWYIGFTTDVEKRTEAHNNGNGARITSMKRNWKRIYQEGYLDKMDALGREKFLKSGSGRKFLKHQLNHCLARIK